ncbi:uncharacterized protein [Amphiura filiformis]|uniref:uncharacterized protein n=1 Tax=Amphiura filiformis TaxID=82378 RepID=UPI003B20C625
MQVDVVVGEPRSKKNLEPSKDKKGGGGDKMEVQQALENLDQRQQQILHNAAEELITQTFLSNVHLQHQQQQVQQQQQQLQHQQQQHQFVQPATPPQYQPHQRRQQVAVVDSVGQRQDQRQEDRMHGQNPETWLDGVNQATLVLHGENMEEVGAVEEVESSVTEDMEVDESSVDAPADADHLINLESPDFLVNLGAAGGGPVFPVTLQQADQQQGVVSMEQNLPSGDEIWNVIAADTSILTSFLSSASGEEQKYSLGTILDVLGINQESGGEEQLASLSQAFPNPSPDQQSEGEQLTDADAEMGKRSQVMWSPPTHIQAYANQQENLVQNFALSPPPAGNPPVSPPTVPTINPSAILPYPAAASIPVPQAISALQQQQTIQGISGPVSSTCVTNAGATPGTSTQAMSGDEASGGSIPSPKLPEYYELVVRGYYRQQELFKIPVATEEGCVLFYKQPKKTPAEDLTKLTLVQFPELTDKSKTTEYTKRVLDVAEKGVLIREKDGYIYATRRCRSKVFFCSSQGDSKELKGDCRELQRDEETRIFDPFLFEKRYRKWLLKGADNDKVSRPRPPNIVFTFAQRWSWNSHHPLMNCLVYAVVTPMRARTQLAWGPGNSDVDSLNRDYSSGMLQISAQSSQGSAGHSSTGMTS